MTQPEPQKSTVFPPYWRKPMYCFGQISHQGIIVGMEYKFPDIYSPQEYYCGWNYTVAKLKRPSEREIYDEPRIELLSPEEAKSFIEEEISIHQNKINLLNQILGNSAIM